MTLLEKLIKNNYDEKNAKSLIMSGNVLVNDEVILIGSHKINENDIIRIKEQKQWVSRGAYKLLEAFEKFNINVQNKNCLDVGSSTGGFTEVLLKKEANKVYSLDSGTNQLDFKLRTNNKVKVLEKTNLKNIVSNMFDSKIDFVCCDVSFISCKHLFDVLNNQNVLSKENDLIILIKPQFEANSKLVLEGGFVEEINHKEIIDNIINYANKNNFKFINICKSPLLGNKSKNVEYLSWFKYKGAKNE